MRAEVICMYVVPRAVCCSVKTRKRKWYWKQGDELGSYMKCPAGVTESEVGEQWVDFRCGSSHDFLLDWMWRVKNWEESSEFSSFIDLRNLVLPFTKTGKARRRQKATGESRSSVVGKYNLKCLLDIHMEITSRKLDM